MYFFHALRSVDFYHTQISALESFLKDPPCLTERQKYEEMSKIQNREASTFVSNCTVPYMDCTFVAKNENRNPVSIQTWQFVD